MPPARTGGQPPDSMGDGLTASRTASRRRSRAILPATARRTAGRNTAPDDGRRTRGSLTARRRQPQRRAQPHSLTARENSATAGRRDGVYIQPRRQPIKLYSPRQPATAAIINRSKIDSPTADIIRAAACMRFCMRFSRRVCVNREKRI